MFSKKVQAISPSPTLAIDAKAKQMKADGIDVIGFGAGEPDFDTPVHIREAAIKAINDGFTRYTPVAGSADLLEAICQKFRRDNGLQYEVKNIVVSNGAKHSLANAFAALLNPGDEVIVPAPYWVSYPEIVKMNDGVPVIVETVKENNFKITPKELQQALTDKTKAILLNSPNNPTGQVYNRAELEAIADFAVEHDLYVVSDEIYEKLIYGGEKHVSIASLGEAIKERTIIVNGVSKAYAMTGWRIGFTASTATLAKMMSSLQSHMASNANSIAQKATIAALSGPQDCVAEMRAAFAARRDAMVEKIAAISGLSCIEPLGAFYVFVDVSGMLGRSCRGRTIKTSDDFAAVLLEEKQVTVVPGTGFGAPEFIRLSYALSMEKMLEGLERIDAFVRSLE
ncbi:MAG: pyridoxal phosphate-dependent aminotransferase [Firmicutes bacterium]|jgi:aspartate aminotransferase|nr:pyridoxal phosphate-dependent aminotransferase [Bacillota bacterium]